MECVTDEKYLNIQISHYDYPYLSRLCAAACLGRRISFACSHEVMFARLVPRN